MERHLNGSFASNISALNLNTSLDDYSIYIKIAFAAVTAPFLILSIFALLSLRRTRSTPPTARFLSSGLITYDVLAVTCFAVRKFIDHHHVNIMTQVVGVGGTYMAYVTIGIMSLERLVIFYSPHFYLRVFTPSKVKNIVGVIWVFFIALYFYIRIGICYQLYSDATPYDIVDKCNGVTFIFYGTTLVIVTVISIACYAKIFIIINYEKRKTNQPQTFIATAKYLQNYKATSLVFVYLVTILVTTLSYAFIISTGLERVPLRLSNDTVNMVNCMMDPCMYVLWYRECRMEMLKVFSVCIPSLRNRIERMRIKIFRIVTVEPMFRANKVKPIFNVDDCVVSIIQNQ